MSDFAEELQAIIAEILGSFNNPSKTGFLMAFGAIARIVTDCKSKDKCGVEFVKIAGVSLLLG